MERIVHVRIATGRKGGTPGELSKSSANMKSRHNPDDL